MLVQQKKKRKKKGNNLKIFVLADLNCLIISISDLPQRQLLLTDTLFCT
jgi:hypothetical protein